MRKKVEEFIEHKVDEKYREIFSRFRALVFSEFPQLKEEMRGGTEKYYGVPVYRLKNIVITVSPTKKGITFSFAEGKKFEDKYSLLEGTGNKTLNLRISKPEDFSEEVMRYYIRQGLVE
jgi:hypothetical protein